MFLRKQDKFLTDAQVSWLEMDQLDRNDHIWNGLDIHVHAKGDLCAGSTTEEGSASPEGAR